MASRLIFRPGLRNRVLLGAIVFSVHLLLVDQLAQEFAGWSNDAEMPRRLQVVYVREMALADPPKLAPVVVAAAPQPDRVNRRPHLPQPATLLPEVVAPAAEAASSVRPEVAASVAASLAASAPADDAPEPSLAVATPAPAQPTPVASAVQSDTAALPFVWPASTLLSYELTGNYRGEVHGSAQVEWINAAPRYQVNLDVTVGLPFAPLFTRQMRSDGQLGSNGLQPQYYQQQSKLAFRDRRRAGLRIADDGVVAEDGRRLPIPVPAAAAADALAYRSTLQDSTSQFVQLSYLFTTQPQLLTPGSRIEFPLALPGGVRDWAYEVVRLETVHTRFGAIDAFLVQPASGLIRGLNQLLAQAWFAPQLGYLPVRIRIEQDAEVFIDLVIKSKPELAAP